MLLGLMAAITVGAFCAGCTPESPPLDPLQPSEEISQMSEQSSAGEHIEISAASSEPVKNQQQELKTTEQSSQITVWKDGAGTPTDMNYSQVLVSGTVNYKCDDPIVLDRLVQSLKDIKVSEKTAQRYDDDSDELTFHFEDGSEQVIFFEHGGLLKDNVRYVIEGYDAVKEILESIKNDSVSDGTEESYDEWVVNVGKVEHRVSVLCGSEEYLRADTNKKRELAEALLRELEDQGLVEKNSVFSTDDSVSYTYMGGGSGGIMLKDFDPMMN